MIMQFICGILALLLALSAGAGSAEAASYYSTATPTIGAITYSGKLEAGILQTVQIIFSEELHTAVERSYWVEINAIGDGSEMRVGAGKVTIPAGAGSQTAQLYVVFPKAGNYYTRVRVFDQTNGALLTQRVGMYPDTVYGSSVPAVSVPTIGVMSYPGGKLTANSLQEFQVTIADNSTAADRSWWIEVYGILDGSEYCIGARDILLPAGKKEANFRLSVVFPKAGSFYTRVRIYAYEGGPMLCERIGKYPDDVHVPSAPQSDVPTIGNMIYRTSLEANIPQLFEVNISSTAQVSTERTWWLEIYAACNGSNYLIGSGNATLCIGASEVYAVFPVTFPAPGTYTTQVRVYDRKCGNLLNARTGKYPDTVGQSTRTGKFMLVSDLLPDAIMDIRYATAYNFVGEVIDGYEDFCAILSQEALVALANANRDLRAQGYGLIIYDAYRPQRAVNHFVSWMRSGNDAMKPFFYPELNKSQLDGLGYISARSSHSSASTVDVGLYRRATGEAVDMGTTFDYFGERSHTYYFGLTQEQMNNRSILRNAMTDNGFAVIGTEWWHFTLRNEPYAGTFFDFPVNQYDFRKY